MTVHAVSRLGCSWQNTDLFLYSYDLRGHVQEDMIVNTNHDFTSLKALAISKESMSMAGTNLAGRAQLP